MTETTGPDVDVVICTRNREGNIATAVESVLANDYPAFTLTVVDQSTTPATGEVLAPIAERDSRLTYVHVDEAGLSRAYNTGVRLTKADVLAFTDDDCVVPTDWVASIASAFESEPEGDLLYGNVTPYESGDETHLTPSLAVDQPEKLSKRDGFRVFGMGANYAARRRVFTKAGPFDEVLGGGGPLKSSQDFDLAYRVYKADSVILLRPEVSIRHDGRREAEDWPTLLRNYGHGDGAFYMKHVRCLDPYAAWLLTRQIGLNVLKSLHRIIVRRQRPAELDYLRGFFEGMRNSFRFKVDRASRLYVEGGGS